MDNFDQRDDAEGCERCGESAEAQAIYESIRRTRRSFDQSIDELHRRLSPRYMGRQAADSIKHAGTDMFHSTINAVKQNPVPAALIGAGMAWFLGCAIRDRVSGRASPGAGGAGTRCENEASMDEGSVQPAASPMAAVAGKVRETTHAASEKISNAAEATRRAVQGAAHAVKDTAADVAGSIKENTKRIAHTADEARLEVQHKARRGYEATINAADHSFQQYPLLMGLSVFAAGVAAAAAFPPTRKENELMGSTRDDLFNTVTDRVQRTARSAADAAAEEARRETLTDPSQLLGEIRQTGGESATEVAQEIGRRAGAVVGRAVDAASRELKPGRDDDAPGV